MHRTMQLTFSKPLSHVTWASRCLPIHRGISHAAVDPSRKIYISHVIPSAREIHVHPSSGPPSNDAASSLRRILRRIVAFCAERKTRESRWGDDFFFFFFPAGTALSLSLSRESYEEREPDEPREGTKCVAVRGRRSTASNAHSGFRLLRNTCPPLTFLSEFLLGDGLPGASADARELGILV